MGPDGSVTSIYQLFDTVIQRNCPKYYNFESDPDHTECMKVTEKDLRSSWHQNGKKINRRLNNTKTFQDQLTRQIQHDKVIQFISSQEKFKEEFFSRISTYPSKFSKSQFKRRIIKSGLDFDAPASILNRTSTKIVRIEGKLQLQLHPMPATTKEDFIAALSILEQFIKDTENKIKAMKEFTQKYGEESAEPEKRERLENITLPSAKENKEVFTRFVEEFDQNLFEYNTRANQIEIEAAQEADELMKRIQEESSYIIDAREDNFLSFINLINESDSYGECGLTGDLKFRIKDCSILGYIPNPNLPKTTQFVSKNPRGVLYLDTTNDQYHYLLSSQNDRKSYISTDSENICDTELKIFSELGLKQTYYTSQNDLLLKSTFLGDGGRAYYKSPGELVKVFISSKYNPKKQKNSFHFKSWNGTNPQLYCPATIL